MDIDWIRNFCLSFPQSTEQIQWGDDLVFKVAGKIHAIAVLNPAKIWLCFKVSPENFAELTERPGIIPAPYLARAKWVALETKDALSPDELAHFLRESYDLVVAKLPKKTREALAGGKPPSPRKSSKGVTTKKVLRAHQRKSKKPSRSREGF
jgi:predicted DNA-binding protein (MmcQ/YjbR family)